jgi:hypothetical protein
MNAERPGLGARLWQLISREPVLPVFAFCLALLAFVVIVNPDSQHNKAKRQTAVEPTALPVLATSQALQLATAVPTPAAVVAATAPPPRVVVQPPSPAAAAPTRAATAVPPTEPTAPPAPTSAAPPAAGPATAPTAEPTPRLLLDERFADNQRGWPNDRQSTAWLDQGAYRLAVRTPGRHVAVGAPIPGSFRDVEASATFHKVSGPPGGGYGLIVRDQGPPPRDGREQGGRYYVLEVGDRGEVGIFRRDVDHWTDLVPFAPSNAVKAGGESNSLTARAVGPRLTLLVNGVRVADYVDTLLNEGGVGIYVAGDGNEVVLERAVFEALN